jgi:hypothetical protein
MIGTPGGPPPVTRMVPERIGLSNRKAYTWPADSVGTNGLWRALTEGLIEGICLGRQQVKDTTITSKIKLTLEHIAFASKNRATPAWVALF